MKRGMGEATLARLGTAPPGNIAPELSGVAAVVVRVAAADGTR
jgi:hypothetical protein